jgi:putative ABC transport system permease protein
MAARETRASWARLLFFFLCIAIGVAAIVTLRSVIQNVRGAVSQEARALAAGDVTISTSREWTSAARAVIDRRLRDAGPAAWTETLETPTMVRPADPARAVARMAELRAVGPEFPLYGTLGLASGDAYRHDLLAGRGVLVRPELLTLLDLRVGDGLAIGRAEFTIRGVLTSEPGRGLGEFSLGPRILIDRADLDATGLVTTGSRVRRVLLVKVGDDRRSEALVTGLRADLADDFVNVRSYRSSDDAVGRDFDRAENYLSLVGLVIVILGGIAVSSVTRVFVAQKMRTIAVLKCLGASSRQIIVVYLLQVLVLGVAGGMLGIGLARGAIAAIPLLVGDARSALATIEYGVTAGAAAQGLAIGVLVSILFSIVPLLQVRRVRPSLVLRDERPAGEWDPVRVAATVGASAALVALTAWQAASWTVGVWVTAGLAGVGVVLVGAGRVLILAVTPLARVPSFALRHGVLRLSRPGNQTRMILLAVGLGAFFVIGARVLETGLQAEFATAYSDDAPDMFLMDIQRDQVDALRARLMDPASGVGGPQIIPVLRARVTGVEGRDVNLESFEDVRARGSLAREYTVTYRDHLEANERIVAGELWRGASADAEVSVERDAAERFGIVVGDVMRFDVLGRQLSARVTSLRAVDWRDGRTGGFVFVFRPGALDQAPQTFIAPLRGPEGAEDRARFQYDLVRQFPNLTVIDLVEILSTVRDVLSRIRLAITVVGALLLLSGTLILIGAVAMTRFQRVYEAAVYRTLGANTSALARMLLVEYLALGLLAGFIGSAAAVGLTWGLSRYALDLPWRFSAAEHLGGLAATALLVAIVGVLASLGVLRRKPLATLRAE